MALRILTYTCLTYEELIRRGEIKPGNELPPLLPVTIYNGRSRWQAAADVAELIAPVKEPLGAVSAELQVSRAGLAADRRERTPSRGTW